MVTVTDVPCPCDLPIVTSQELVGQLFGERKWLLVRADAAIRQTAKAVLFGDTDDGKPANFWVPKSALERVNYKNGSGEVFGAFRFPFRFAR